MAPIIPQSRAASKPAFTTQPTISGTFAEGGTLTANVGASSGFPAPAVSYRWLRNGDDTGVANAPYPVKGADVGYRIDLQVDTGTEPNKTTSVVKGSTVRKLKVLMLIKTGNSHSVGYDLAQGGDVFDARILEMKQNGTIAAPSGAMLDDGDTLATPGARLSPFFSMLNLMAAARPDADRIIIVPNGQGATGFTVGSAQGNSDTWNADPLMQPNRLTKARDRWEACYALHVNQGYDVEVIGAFHVSAQPDADVSSTLTIMRKQNAYADNIDAYIDYVRASLSGFGANTPVIVAHGMNNIQYTGLAADGQTYASAGHGVPKRRAYAHTIDPIFSRGDGEQANLPVPSRSQNVGDVSGDTTHANRVGDLTKGRLLYAALLKARANVPANLRAPFPSLSSYNAMRNLYDFRTGVSRDRMGNGPDLVQTGDAPPIRYSTLFLTDVFDRVGGNGRMYTRSESLPGAYSIVTRLSVDAINTIMMLLGSTKGAAAGWFTFQIDASNRLVAGHGITPQLVAAIPSHAVTTIETLGITYDGATLKGYKNGVEIGTVGDTASPVPPPNPATLLTLGASRDDTWTGPFAGDMQYMAIFSSAISAAQMLELHNATYL